MRLNYLFIVLIVIIFVQCSTSAQKENESASDTTAIDEVAAQAEEVALEEQISDESLTLNLDEFAKHPFESDYPYIKSFLREEGIDFTLIAEDTIHSEHRIIEFDSSRIDFLDSDERFQAELGDLICSSDINSREFRFNQGVSIGITQEDFLSRTGLIESALEKDETTGLSYYEYRVTWGEDDGYWQVTFWFKGGLLVRILTKISPCYYDYGD